MRSLSVQEPMILHQSIHVSPTVSAYCSESVADHVHVMHCQLVWYLSTKCCDGAGAKVVSNAVTAEDAEGVVLAGASEDGKEWARLAWLGDWTTVDLDLDQHPSGEAASIVSVAFGAKDASSKEAAQNSIRQDAQNLAPTLVL